MPCLAACSPSDCVDGIGYGPPPIERSLFFSKQTSDFEFRALVVEAAAVGAYTRSCLSILFIDVSRCVFQSSSLIVELRWQSPQGLSVLARPRQGSVSTTRLRLWQRISQLPWRSGFVQLCPGRLPDISGSRLLDPGT